MKNRITKKTSHENSLRGLPGEQGMVLILTLWVLTILSLLFLTLTLSVDLNTREVIAMKRELKSAAAARGAISVVCRQLIELHAKLKKKPSGAVAANGSVPAPKKPDSTVSQAVSDIKKKLAEGHELGYYVVKPDLWTVKKYGKNDTLPEVGNWLNKDYVVCNVTAEDSKALLTSVKTKGWKDIFGMPQPTIDKLQQRLKKYKNRIFCIEQLLAIGELNGKMYDGGDGKPGLKNVVTTFSGGKLYINRASAEAVALVLNIDIKKAKILSQRTERGNYFTGLNNLTDFTGLTATVLSEHVTMVCNSYRISAYAVSEGRVYKLEAVLYFSAPDKMKLAYLGSV